MRGALATDHSTAVECGQWQHQDWLTPPRGLFARAIQYASAAVPPLVNPGRNSFFLKLRAILRSRVLRGVHVLIMGIGRVLASTRINIGYTDAQSSNTAQVYVSTLELAGNVKLKPVVTSTVDVKKTLAYLHLVVRRVDFHRFLTQPKRTIWGAHSTSDILPHAHI